MRDPVTVLLMGNPNVGKSTVFNRLTGMRQHTGNWPGKTVETARGRYRYGEREYLLVDLPGTYSLDPRSAEEQVALEALDRGDFDCVAVVCDGGMLERNLILVYQLLERRVPLVVCVNLLDEARRRGVKVDTIALGKALGVPVAGCSAARGEGLEGVKELIGQTAQAGASAGFPVQTPERRAVLAAYTARRVTRGTPRERDARIDRLLTGRRTAIPVMLLALLGILWLTIAGANVPSELLWRGTMWLYERLRALTELWPWWVRGALLDGVLLTAGRVVSVMLPPMAIFFPLFTLLEDLGFLPRMAYNLDRGLQRCGGCGKTALTYCMGLGCNAAGVTGCRIIDSPRERLMGILTNSFIPCNGRFGGLILLITACLAPGAGSLGAAAGLLGFLLLGILGAMGAGWLLSRTILRGMPSAFVLELPPYRMPRVRQVVIRSMLDRTGRVLGRAAMVAAPAGLILWILTAAYVGDRSLLGWMSWGLDPLGRALGMNGVLLAAFILGWPANEIVLPVAVLAVTGAGGMTADALGIAALGMSRETALCTAVFFLLHWPCATTCLTVKKETGSLRWTALSMALPTLAGAGMCLLIHGAFTLLGML